MYEVSNKSLSSKIHGYTSYLFGRKWSWTVVFGSNEDKRLWISHEGSTQKIHETIFGMEICMS
jgi:hypothetical protein